MSEKIIINKEDTGIVILKMNDAEEKNTFTDSFIADVNKGLEKIENMKPKVLILQGLPDVFCGGAEKKNLIDLCDGKFNVKDFIIQEKLLDLPFPVIAAMEGHAVGGGLMLALCCDIVLVSRESRYGVIFMELGFTPGMGCTTLLAELVGFYIANEMMFSGKRFRGSDLALKSTNINYILPRENIMPKARDIALRISEKNIETIYLLKNTLNTRRKKLLIDARAQEDLMHRISFAFPETRATIEELYIEQKKSEK